MKRRNFMFDKLKDYFDLQLPLDARGKDKFFLL
jgi:hypothetical protein